MSPFWIEAAIKVAAFLYVCSILKHISFQLHALHRTMDEHFKKIEEHLGIEDSDSDPGEFGTFP